MGQFTIAKLNQLEKRAFAAEESASEVRWEQADGIVDLLDSGMTQQAVAQDWVNLETGEPYHRRTVGKYAQLARAGSGPRGDFREAYYTLDPTGASEARTERAISQLPSNKEGLVVQLERITDILADKYHHSAGEIAGVVHDRFKPRDKEGNIVRGTSEPAPKATVTDYDRAVEALLLVREIEKVTQRTATKLEEIRLEVDVLLDEAKV